MTYLIIGLIISLITTIIYERYVSDEDKNKINMLPLEELIFIIIITLIWPIYIMYMLSGILSNKEE